MAAFSWVVNRMNQGYGVNIPLNAKEKREHTFKILNEWPNVVKESHLKNIYNPKKGYNFKINSRPTRTTYNLMKPYIKQHKRVWKTFLNGMGLLNHSKTKKNRLIHFSNAANMNLVENELSHSAKELHAQKPT